MSLSIGLIGCGRWGRTILRDLIALDARVHVAAASEMSRRAAIEAGAAGASPDIAGFPKDIDGYVVATPTSTHAEVIEQLLPSGKPVFVEKPMTNDVAAARSLIERAGERIFVMDKWRYHPGVEALADAARSSPSEVIGSAGRTRIRTLTPFGSCCRTISPSPMRSSVICPR
jgi:predicted dehydrogenase